MLKIKNEQMKQLQMTKFEKFVDLCWETLKIKQGSIMKAYSEKDAKLKIKKYCLDAKEHFNIRIPGLHYEYCSLAFQSGRLEGPVYEKRIDEILTWPERKEEQKIEILKKYLLNQE